MISENIVQLNQVGNKDACISFKLKNICSKLNMVTNQEVYLASDPIVPPTNTTTYRNMFESVQCTQIVINGERALSNDCVYADN